MIVVCLFGNVYGLKNSNCNATNSNFYNTYIFAVQVAQQLSNMNLIKINPNDIHNNLMKPNQKRKWIKIKWKSDWELRNQRIPKSQDHTFSLYFISRNIIIIIKCSEWKRRKTARAHQYIKSVDMALPLPFPLPDSILF